MRIVESDWLTVTWSFRQPNISRNHRFEHLLAVEVAQVGGYGRGEVRALVIHRQQAALRSSDWDYADDGFEPTCQTARLHPPARSIHTELEPAVTWQLSER